MSWKQYLTSPPPTTSWALDDEVIAGLRSDPKAGAHWAAETTPEGTFDVGPVGLQSVDRRKLVTILGSIQGRLDGSRRAAVVVPSLWTRCYRLEFQELPRRHAEIEQIVQWRLKKLLPVSPTDLRMSLAPQTPANGTRPMLVMVALERVLAELEGAFADAGVGVGLITGRNFALASSGLPEPALLVQQERSLLSLLLIDRQEARLVRTKPLAASGRTGDIVRRELGLTLGYIRSTLGLEGEIGLAVTAETGHLESEIEDWRSQQQGVTRLSLPALPSFAEGGALDRLGQARLRPACAVMAGAPQ